MRGLASRFSAVLPFSLAPAVAFAHTFNAAPGVEWTWEPWLLLCLCAASTGYALGLYRLRTEGRRPTALGGAHPWAFVAGIAVLLIALDSPLDQMSEQLFAAHMTQHLLLMLAAPPLLIWSRPLSAWLWAFPPAQRRWIGQAWLRSGPLIRVVQFLSRPIPAWLACAGALWLWHLPSPYQLALAHPVVHVLEHASFFVTSLMFWNVALNPRSNVLGAGGALLFVATFALQNGLLGAILAFAGRPFYAAHVHTTVAWNLTPLQDQQLAGLIMWIPAGTVHLLALSVLFVQWLQSAERNAARRAYTVPARRRSARAAEELADV